MPGIPLVARETTCSRGADQMCRQDSRVHLSVEEEAAAEESLSIYCKPVELYNILQRRAIKNPSFLQRCLEYKKQVKHKKRIQMEVSLPVSINDGSQTQNLFPLCIMLARPLSNLPISECACYRFNRFCMITSCGTSDKRIRTHAKFILPEFNKLSADIRSGSLSICFISCVGNIWDDMDFSSSSSNAGGHCLVGKIPMELLHLSWEENSSKLSTEDGAETLLTVEMLPCFMKKSYLDKDKIVSFQMAHSSIQVSSQQLQVCITAGEVGAKEAKQQAAYDSFSYNEVPSSSLAHIVRLRTGNVVFNYKYYNNKLQRTEVTEDFSCPFCLVKCASFKGLRCHLLSSHDLFNFEFWVSQDYQSVGVSVRTDSWRSEIIADGVDPKQQTFFFCSRPFRRRKRKRLNPNVQHVHPLILDSDLPEPVNHLPDRSDEFVEHDASSPIAAGVSSGTAHSHVDPESLQSLPGSSLAASTMLQFAKTRKLSAERSDPKNRALLQKRQFFHSHRAQPMALEQVLSDRDSEDEVDDDVADFEDRRMLDDFVDVTKYEKQMMHLWNSFVRKQRVLADGHIPWACEAFSKLHVQVLVQEAALLWCWRLFMIKLWNHGLLDARSMNNCNLIIEQFQNKNTDPSCNRKNKDNDPMAGDKKGE